MVPSERKRSPSLQARVPLHLVSCINSEWEGEGGGGRQIEWLLTEERMNHVHAARENSSRLSQVDALRAHK